MMNPEAPELWQVRLLLSKLGYEPVPTVERGVAPEPDVVIPYLKGVGTVGVEVTDLNPRGLAPRRDQGEANLLVQTAKRLYEERGYPSVGVWVFWSASVAFHKSSRQAMALDLAACVEGHLPALGSIRDLCGEEDPPPLLPAGVNRLVIHRYDQADGVWFCPRFEFVANIEPKHIEEAVERKNPKLSNYMDSYAQRWLLLVAGSAGTANAGLIPDTLGSQEFESEFDRIYVASLQEPRVSALKVRAT
jgi:hypothetical protein